MPLTEHQELLNFLGARLHDFKALTKVVLPRSDDSMFQINEQFSL